jgi:4-oxalocrotonate tautomerase
MPHVVVNLYSGRSEHQKRAVADALAEAVTSTLNYGEDSVSVGIEDMDPTIGLSMSINPTSSENLTRSTRRQDTICDRQAE